MKTKILTLCLLFPLICFGKVEFKDQSGNTITLQNEAKKVVAIPIPFGAMSICIDKNTSRLISINPVAKEAITKGILGKIFPKSLNLSTQGIGSNFTPNIEELLALKPDLVFQWSQVGEKLIKPLKHANMNVALVKYGQEKQVLGWFSMMGKAYGQEKRVDKILNYREKTKQRLENYTMHITKKPKVLYFLRYKSALRVAGNGTFNSYSINLAGGKNAPDDIKQFKTVNKEQILKYNPDIILLNNFEKNLSPKDIFNDPILSMLKAVKQKRVYKMPLGGYRWDPPSQESPLAWLWMYKIFYPNLAKFNLRYEIKKAYKDLYDYDLNPNEISQILRMDMNKNSKFYEKLN